MKNYRYIIMAAMLAAAVSCGEKISTDPDSGLGTPIKFSAGIETKAFLNSGDINVTGTQMAIYGYENSTALIDGVKSTYDATKGWDLDKDYQWSDGKSYAFFSYLTKDKDGHSAPYGTLSGRTLAVPAKAFDFAATDNDFDFCYSDVVYRPANKPDHSVVNLNLKHLYTAIGFSAHNYTGSVINVKEVILVGLKKLKSATINFEDTGTKVDYKAASVEGGSKKLNGGIITLAKDRECANIVGVASDTPAYYMYWPQTSEELTAQGWSDSGTEPGGGAYIKVVYSQGGPDIIRYARFPQDNDGTKDLGWLAGTKRMMQIAFRKEQITIKLSAAPWDYSEPDIKYHDEVDVDSALQFESSTCTIDATTHTVYFKGGNPITGSFKLKSPEGATLVISKEGDYDAFEIDMQPEGDYGDGEDCNSGPVDVTNGNTFTIYPTEVSTSGEYSIQISFSIRYPDGESISIDDDIQPVKWTIIFTK